MTCRGRSAIVVVALVVAACCLGYLSTRYRVTGDWSHGASATLTPASRAVLARLKGPVQITSYARPQGKQRAAIQSFIARYQRFKPGITLHFIDPEADPAATRAAGITVNGELVVRYHGRKRYLTLLSERSLTNALASLARGGSRIVAVVTGDGERRASGSAPGDLGVFMAGLAQRGVRAVPLDFTHVAQVPANTQLVVLASPTSTLLPGAVKALLGYVENGGNLLWLTEPNAGAHGLGPLAQLLGFQVLPGILVDGRGSAIGLTDPRLVATASYPPQQLTRDFHLTAVFPRVAALAQVNMGGWKVTPLLRSSAQSWTQRQPINDAHASTIHFDAAAGDIKGPLNFGLALTRLSPSPSHDQQRVVVIGGGSFLANAWIGQGGNQAFGDRLFNWLLGDDVLIGVPPTTSRVAPLRLSQHGLDWLAGVFGIGLPLLLLIGGGVVLWRRRRS